MANTLAGRTSRPFRLSPVTSFILSHPLPAPSFRPRQSQTAPPQRLPANDRRMERQSLDRLSLPPLFRKRKMFPRTRRVTRKQRSRDRHPHVEHRRGNRLPGRHGNVCYDFRGQSLVARLMPSWLRCETDKKSPPRLSSHPLQSEKC